MGQLLGYRLEIHVLAHEFMKLRRDEGGIGVGVGIGFQHRCHLARLVDDHWDEQVAEGDEKERHLEEGHKGGYHPAFKIEQLTVELDKGFEEVGDQTTYAEVAEAHP